jgi:hypothetical protein
MRSRSSDRGKLHRGSGALDWPIGSADSFHFFGVEVELWRIGIASSAEINVV